MKKPSEKSSPGKVAGRGCAGVGLARGVGRSSSESEEEEEESSLGGGWERKRERSPARRLSSIESWYGNAGRYLVVVERSEWAVVQ